MTTLVRWEPFRDLASMQSEMSRLVNGLFTGGASASQTWVPPLDVWETENEIVYAFDLPGIPEEDIDLEVQDHSLTISATRKQEVTEESDRFYRFERRYGSFSRSVGLPQNVDEQAIKADYKNGVLEVHVPKPEEAKPRRIQVGKSAPRDIEASPSS